MISISPGDESGLEPPGSVELPLAAYKAATLRSVGGLVTSRGIEPRSLGLQPSAMTTPARWSLDGGDGGSRTRACALRGRRAAGNTSSTLVQARGLEPRFSGNRPEVLPLDEAWDWSRRLGSNQHRSA